ncbi:21496_t:CDS:2, partial [Dentiscutata erythropus]
TLHRSLLLCAVLQVLYFKENYSSLVTTPLHESNNIVDTLIWPPKEELTNYDNSMEIDLVVVQETDETSIPYSECSFDYNSWKNWMMKSGTIVIDMLKQALRIKGQKFRELFAMDSKLQNQGSVIIETMLKYKPLQDV